MPKESRNLSRLSSDSQSLRYKPYSRYGQSVAQETSSADGEDSAERKEWEEATCPVCMEHPHNAVLLICSSYGKGCRPYMCDTSYRHSNCLDQYRKAHELRDTLPLASVGEAGVSGTERAVLNRVDDFEGERGSGSASERVVRGLGGNGGDNYRREASVEVNDTGDDASGQVSVEASSHVGNTNSVVPGEDADAGELLCPLCRGKVKGWKVVEAARAHLNQKTRTCAQESCNFSGPYEELRKHARCTHPLARPSEIDRTRQDRWIQLERQRDLGDVLSTIQSTMPGATVLGDYVIDGDGEGDDEGGDDNDFPGDDGNWWTVFLLFQVLGPASSIAGSRGLPSLVRGRYHPARNSAARSTLWGEPVQGNSANRLAGNPSGNNENLGGGLGSRSHRRRSRERGRGHGL
ncbi:uncharacterized protein [Physcomitrium patens]|uniref:Uncharacterized protein n=1 Tax=Physcomitrium patens TaxID=3218 RepID=A0A2K1KI87_PHYPA|nr:uncharacterized protein LOC112282333 [Physcomitrium patens]XP_024375559.1 uncharacterized protein LOC112282333 [Physcomitrium patens]XP_024375560.1 uncharacterized protein LOC112282333 [Physcomitrium patens]PNR53494.1 hypothetical protein PHYPA_007169 [Physcomitrium patens]|eukprot:XP_024375558.1 uncharacterized protein LOC112282333 [Physcomitrella patens]